MTKVWPNAKFVQAKDSDFLKGLRPTNIIKSKIKVTRDIDDWVESFYNYFQPLHDIMVDNIDVFVYRNPHIFPRAHAKLELLRIQMATFSTETFCLI